MEVDKDFSTEIETRERLKEVGAAAKRNANQISGRTFCEIFGDMRICNKTQNYSYLLGLIEEAQYRASRMEDRLSRVDDIVHAETHRNDLIDGNKEFKKEIRELRVKKRELQTELGIDDNDEYEDDED